VGGFSGVTYTTSTGNSSLVSAARSSREIGNAVVIAEKPARHMLGKGPNPSAGKGMIRAPNRASPYTSEWTVRPS